MINKETEKMFHQYYEGTAVRMTQRAIKRVSTSSRAPPSSSHSSQAGNDNVVEMIMEKPELQPIAPCKAEQPAAEEVGIITDFGEGSGNDDKRSILTAI